MTLLRRSDANNPAHAPPSIAGSGRALGAAVVVLAIAAYSNAFGHGFAADDVGIILENPAIHHGRLRDLVTGGYWPGTEELYRPVVLLSYALDWATFGNNPSAFHIVNVLLHAAVTWLLFDVLRHLNVSTAAAAAAAAVFAVHPVHVEAVANVVGRAEILSCGFVLLACRVHLARPGHPGWRIAAIAVCYFLALGSKEIAVTLPALLVLLDGVRHARRGGPAEQWWRKHLLLQPLLAGTLFLYLLGRWAAIGTMFGTAPVAFLSGLSTSDRLATAGRLVPEYMRLLFWPADLSVEWAPATLSPATWNDPLATAGWMLALVLLVFAVVAWRMEPLLSAAVLWFAITILPVSQLLFPVGFLLAERVLYLPSAALGFLIAAIAGNLRIPVRAYAAGVLVVVLLATGTRTWLRTPIWRSTPAVVASLIEEHPEVWRVRVMEANAYLQRGMSAPAEARLRTAAELTRGRSYPVNLQLASVLLSTGRPAEAERLTRAALGEVPDGSIAHLHLLAALLDQGRDRAVLRASTTARPLLEGRWSDRQSLDHMVAIAHDGLGQRDSAEFYNRASIERSANRGGVAQWVHRARLAQLGGDTVLANAAVDSARVRLEAHYRPHFLRINFATTRTPLIRPWWRLGQVSPGEDSAAAALVGDGSP